MPDDQFAVNVKPVEMSYATLSQDVLVSPQLRPVTTPPSSVRELPDKDAMVGQQERLIQRAYDELSEVVGAAYPTRVSALYRLSKRALDISLALPALIVLAPVMLLVATLIRLDSPGPALFKQQRVGKNGRLFCMYKFRSMTIDAGVRLNGIHKSATDNRITRVGRFIRKTSLDELPQLVNVLLGQMSLVGPRPELPEIVLQRYEPWQYRRLDVPQGITGWWQVTGRGKKMLWKHTADDLYYVDRASFWFDLKLIFMTVRAVLGRDGAF